MVKTRQIDTEYVRLDGDKFTVAATRGQFYGASCKRPTVSDREWAGMIRDAISVEQQILKEMNIVFTPDLTV